MIGDGITNVQSILEHKFIPFEAKITDVCVSNRQKQLVNKYRLNRGVESE